MAIEQATYIEDFDTSFPLFNDLMSEADNHQRLIKSVLQNTFTGVNFAGLTAAVVSTEVEINYLQGVNTATTIQAQLLEAIQGQVPAGGIMPYAGLVSSIPVNYVLCDGNNNTPDLTNRFVMGTIGDFSNGLVAGSHDSVNVLHNHTEQHSHTGSAASAGNHTHQVPLYDTSINSGPFDRTGSIDGTTNNMNTYGAGAHPHSSSQPSNSFNTDDAGSNGLLGNMPPFVTLAYIMRVA